MKFFFLIYALLICSLVGRAQQFSPTSGIPCTNCHPTNYEDLGNPWISDVNRPGGVQNKSWNHPGLTELPVPPSSFSQGLPVGGGKNSFVTLKTSEGTTNDKVYLIVSGFNTSKEYKIKYYVLSGSVYDASTQNMSPFGESAKLTITTTDFNPALVKDQVTDFTSSNQNKWIEKELTFTPLTSSLKFTLSGTTMGNVPGYINFSIDKYPFNCLLPTDQVLLTGPTTKNTVFPGDKIDLAAINTFNATPVTAELVWKSGPNSTDPTLTAQEASNAPISNANPMNVKPYYAFYYAKDFNCYNVPVSQAEVKFLYFPTQVPINGSGSIVLNCPAVTADLTTKLDNPVAPVIWFTTPDHTGNPVENPKVVPPGHYYAFYFDLYRGGFSLAGSAFSTADVVVDYAIAPGIPDLGLTISFNSLIFPPNGSKDFVIKVQNLKAENSNCSVFFKISKLPGFNVSYSTASGAIQINGSGTINTNNDFWTFTDEGNYITVTSKTGIAASGYSYIGFKITRGVNTPSGSIQNLSITIPQSGGGGETNVSNNQTITTLMAN